MERRTTKEPASLTEETCGFGEAWRITVGNHQQPTDNPGKTPKPSACAKS